MNTLQVKTAAKGAWPALLGHITGLSSKVFKNIHQPCPLCRKGRDRYRFDDLRGDGNYYCNVCGAGDGILFLQKYLKKSELEVVSQLSELIASELGSQLLQQKVAKRGAPEIRVICPAPIGCPPPSFKHYKYGQPSKVWEYKNYFGATCFFICRFEMPGGGKEVLPLSWCHYLDRQTGEMKYGWRFKGVTKDSGYLRPLYNTSGLVESYGSEKWIVVSEGEKAADAAAEIFKDLVSTTWSGGGRSLNMSDWSALAKQNVLIWPDNDSEGYSTAIELYQMLMEINPNRTVRMVELVDMKPVGWDLADALSERADHRAIQAFVSKHSFNSLVCPLG